jgi:riboflavin kinase/FMN adenylyltransferase
LLYPQKAPPYLASLSHKIEDLESLGVLDAVVIARFDLEFANMTATQFVERILVAKLGTKEVRVGGDFRYGKGRAGSVMDLEAAGQTHGFDVKIVHPIAEDGERVSSTMIRTLVADGKVEQAQKLLGRAFAMRGTVGHGKKLGRTIGYPTANLVLEEARQIYPLNGVYAGWVSLPSRGEGPLPAAISVGTNPTTDGASNVVKVEAFLLNGFDADIYGERIDIGFTSRLRGERHFESVEALVAQMKIDCDLVLKLSAA